MARSTADVQTAPKRWVEIDLGDTEITVEEFPDGMFVLRLNGDGEPLVLNAEQMSGVVRSFVTFGKDKGWR